MLEEDKVRKLIPYVELCLLFFDRESEGLVFPEKERTVIYVYCQRIFRSVCNSS